MTPRSLWVERTLAKKPGKITSVITYLEMTHAPHTPPPPPPIETHAIMLAKPVTVSFYRYLYNTVGADNLWWERRVLSEEDLGALVQTEDVDVFVLYMQGTPAGYYELFQVAGSDTIEIAYFGLLPDFIGRGLGAYMLRCALDEAWRRGPEKVTVNTCDLDHPNALQNYQRAGFAPVDQKTRTIDDPRALGIF